MGSMHQMSVSSMLVGTVEWTVEWTVEFLLSSAPRQEFVVNVDIS